MGPRNRFQGMISASLCSLAGRYDNPLPPRFLAPIDSLKIPEQNIYQLEGVRNCIITIRDDRISSSQFSLSLRRIIEKNTKITVQHIRTTVTNVAQYIRVVHNCSSAETLRFDHDYIIIVYI